jgi:hypothetical protein
VPIWEHLIEHIRSGKETDLIRANLAANGIVLNAGAQDDQKELEEEKKKVKSDNLGRDEGEINLLGFVARFFFLFFVIFFFYYFFDFFVW